MERVDINVSDLILEIYARRMLWDQKDVYYHNRIMVEKNWSDVEKAMKQSKDQLKKKWKILRDQFRNECKKITLNPEDSREDYTSITWPHFRSMLFLRTQIKRRKYTKNLQTSTTAKQIFNELDYDKDLDDLNTAASCNESVAEIELEDEDEDDASFQTEKPVTKKRRTDTSVDNEIPAKESKKFELLENIRDDDEAFFYSLLPYMKSLDMKEKLHCRMDIQSIVYKHAFPGTFERKPAVFQNNNCQYSEVEVKQELIDNSL